MEIGKIVSNASGGSANGAGDLEENGQLLDVVWVFEVNVEGATENKAEYVKKSLVVDGFEPALQSELC